jgi:hypothetical protein
MSQERSSLKDDCELLRVGTNAPSIDKVSGQILRGAFLRREPHPVTGEKRDVQGLSVNLREKRPVTQTVADWKNCHMIAALTVHAVRGIEATPRLDVIQTTEDRDYHANLTGLPERGPHVSDTNVTESERLATLLAKASKAVYIRGKGLLEEG